MTATLSALTIGSLTLDPVFDPDVTEYEASTSNATNKVTAVATDEDAEIVIELNGVEMDNETSATWETGENTLTITVTNGDEEEVYTVTVTKT